MHYITVGQIKISSSKIDFLPFFKYVYSPIELKVNSLALYESQLLFKEAKYKVSIEFPLH